MKSESFKIKKVFLDAVRRIADTENRPVNRQIEELLSEALTARGLPVIKK